jgi:hypothetical protein
MARRRSTREPPRAGVNDSDAFVGEQPSRPPGLDPFDARYEDNASEREAALELLPKMTRVTGSYQAYPDTSSSRVAIIVAALVGIALATAALYVLFVN